MKNMHLQLFQCRRLLKIYKPHLLKKKINYEGLILYQKKKFLWNLAREFFLKDIFLSRTALKERKETKREAGKRETIEKEEEKSN